MQIYPATFASLLKIKHFISQEAKKYGWKDHKWEIVIEEVISNIIKHSESKYLEINCNLTKEKMIIAIKDWGKPFDPIRDLACEGFGLKLIKELVEDVSYQRQDECNILMLTRMRSY